MQKRLIGAVLAVAVALGGASLVQATPYSVLDGNVGPFPLTPNTSASLANISAGTATGVDNTYGTGFAGIDITGLSGTDFAFIDLNFNQTLFSGDFLEADGSFDITVAGSGFEIAGIELSLFGSGSFGSGLGFGFIEAATEDAGGTTDLFTQIVRANGQTDIDDINVSRGLSTPVDTFTFNWSIFAENDGVDSMTLNYARFGVTLRDTTPPNVVPLPAGLPLPLAGLGMFSLLRRRQ